MTHTVGHGVREAEALRLFCKELEQWQKAGGLNTRLAATLISLGNLQVSTLVCVAGN